MQKTTDTVRLSPQTPVREPVSTGAAPTARGPQMPFTPAAGPSRRLLWSIGIWMGTLVLLGLVAMLVVWLAFGTRTVETGVRMGWVGNNVPGHMNAQFAWLDGTEGQSFEVGSGHTIVLEYAATASIGSLRIEIRGPNDAVLWQTAPTGGATRHAEVRITQSGRYTVFVVGQNALGGYDVQWWVR